MSEAIQYTIIGIIILGAIVWIGWKAGRAGKRKDSGCCGCTLSETCVKIKKSKDGGKNKCEERPDIRNAK